MVDDNRKHPSATDARPDPADDPGPEEQDDEIMAELRAAREALWADAGYDVREVFRRSHLERIKSGRPAVDLSVKPAVGEK